MQIAFSPQVYRWALARFCRFQPSFHLIAGCSVNVIMQSADHSGSQLWLSQFGVLCSDVHCLCIVQAALWAFSPQVSRWALAPCSQVLLLPILFPLECWLLCQCHYAIS